MLCLGLYDPDRTYCLLFPTKSENNAIVFNFRYSLSDIVQAVFSKLFHIASSCDKFRIVKLEYCKPVLCCRPGVRVTWKPDPGY